MQLSELPESGNFCQPRRNLIRGQPLISWTGSKALKKLVMPKLSGNHEAHLTVYPNEVVKTLLEQWRQCGSTFDRVRINHRRRTSSRLSAVSLRMLAFTAERAAGEVCDRCRRIDSTTAERSYHAVIQTTVQAL